MEKATICKLGRRSADTVPVERPAEGHKKSKAPLEKAAGPSSSSSSSSKPVCPRLGAMDTPSVAIVKLAMPIYKSPKYSCFVVYHRSSALTRPSGGQGKTPATEKRVNRTSPRQSLPAPTNANDTDSGASFVCQTRELYNDRIWQ